MISSDVLDFGWGPSTATVNVRSRGFLTAGAIMQHARAGAAVPFLEHVFLVSMRFDNERSLSGGSLGSSVDEGRS